MKKKRTLSVITAIALFLSCVLGISGTATAKNLSYTITESEAKSNRLDVMDENTAVTLASLFVLSNVKEDKWSMDTQIEQAIPLIGKNAQIAAYCVVFSCFERTAGYVIVSTNLYDQLIVEYSPSIEYITDYITKEKIMLSQVKQPLYYSGSLRYSYNPTLVEEEHDIIITEEMMSIHAQNEELIHRINPIVLTLVGGYITNPLYFLELNYPGYVFGLSGSGTTDFVWIYEIEEWNACVPYATAAIIKYYLSSYNYTTIKNNCLSIAENGGYAPNASDENYYITNLNTIGYIQACINYYGLNKTVGFSTTGLIWTMGIAEINANRPFILHIATSYGYSDHSVTAFAWRWYIDNGANYYKFFEVRDGYVDYSRFVYVNSTLAYLTKIS